MNISVLSFNIRCCDDPDGYSVAERAPRLNAITALYNADILGLQECRPHWEPYIEKYFLDKYDMFNKYRARTEDVESSPILWRKDRYDCIKTGYFWLSDTPEKESRGWDEIYNCYRMCVYVILKDKRNGTTFTVMNTHFGFGDKGQLLSVDLIYKYSKEISSYPTLIVGDFNMTPKSAPYAAAARLFTDVNAVTAKDLGDTYHAYHPEVFKDQHIDYCFIDEKITPIGQKIIRDTVDGKFPSDHFGLFTTLKI